MTKRLNHSRHLDYYAKDVGNRAYWRAKETPTAKQVKFFKQLYAMCKENNVDPALDEYARTRVEFAMAIDTLLERLKEVGVDVEGNGKEAHYVMTHKPDRRGRYWTNERIEVE